MFAPHLEPGAILDRFEVAELLQRRPGCERYRARHRGLACDVALDVFPAGAPYDAEFAAQIVEARRRLERLRNVRAQRMFDSGVAEGRVWVATQLLEADDLAVRLLRPGGVTLPQLLSWLGQMAEVLDRAHRRGLIHGDVHAGQLLVDVDGGALVAGFGLTPRRLSPYGAAASDGPSAHDDVLAFGELVLHALGCVAGSRIKGRFPALRIALQRSCTRRNACRTFMADVSAAMSELECEGPGSAGARRRPWQRRWQRTWQVALVLAVAIVLWRMLL